MFAVSYELFYLFVFSLVGLSELFRKKSCKYFLLGSLLGSNRDPIRDRGGHCIRTQNLLAGSKPPPSAQVCLLPVPMSRGWARPVQRSSNQRGGPWPPLSHAGGAEHRGGGERLWVGQSPALVTPQSHILSTFRLHTFWDLICTCGICTHLCHSS